MGTNDRDLHDPALDAAWRAHSREEPPARLDAAILAAAHRASGAGPRDVTAEARGPWQWWWPLAAAATIGTVAIGVIQLVPADRDAATVVSDAPRATLAKRERATPEPKPVTRAKEADAGATSPVAAAESPAAVDANKPAPSRSIAPATRSVTAQVRKQASVPSAPAPAAAPPPPALEGRADDAKASPPAREGRVDNAKVSPPAREERVGDAKASQETATDRVAANTLAPKAPIERDAPASAGAKLAKDAPAPDPFPGKQTAQAAAPAAAPSIVEEERKTERQGGLTRGEPGPTSDMRARRADTARAATAPTELGAAKPAPPPAAPPAAAFAPSPAGPAQRDQVGAGGRMAQAVPPGPAGGSVVTPLAKQKSIDEAIATMRRLRAEGRFDEAVKELAAFRAAHADADARLPPDLRAWAASVRLKPDPQ